MDTLLIAVAFALGFLARQIGLPPMIGFLIAGFVLNGLGVEGGEFLQDVADLGVTLLLFSIGLKLDLKSLTRPEVWGGATLHMAITIALFGAGIFIAGAYGMPFFSDLSQLQILLVAFALSFSSTVFAVKILEEKGEMGSLHGRVSIGILIMQDIFAVLFLTFSVGKLPSPWAILVPLALFALRPLLFRLIDLCDHGELLILFGFFAALVVGAGGFELVGLKADLGALILGIVLAGHHRSSELAKSLLGFKELFLVGFFLTIGLNGLPSLSAIGVAALLVVAAPLKVFLFLVLLTRFRLRARSALLASLSLANYSEFGLIVAAVGASSGWLSSEWLVIIALALSVSFVIASPLNATADTIYTRKRNKLVRLETSSRHPDDQPIHPGKATIAVFGMGRLGKMAYDNLAEKQGETIIGIDFDKQRVKQMRDEGRNVIYGDATDPDFWLRIQPDENIPVKLALLAMPKHQANLTAAIKLKEKEFPGFITAVAHFDDQVEELKMAGVHAAFNFYNEAGIGFAEHAWDVMEEQSR